METTIILLVFSLILHLPPITLIFPLKKDRKTFFIVSSIYAICVSFLFFKFGANLLSCFNIKQGVINYTLYVYKNLFIFSPLLGLFFVSLHKLFAQKKQLILLIALKYVLPIILNLILADCLKFSHLLWLLAGVDFITTLISFMAAVLISPSKQ